MILSQLKNDGTLHVSVSGEIYAWDSFEATEFIAALSKDDVKNVLVEIDTYGGDYFAAVSVANAIRSFNVPKTAQVLGTCISAGNVILLACEKRIAYPNTFFLIHGVSAMFAGNVAEAKKQISDVEKIDNDLLDLFVSNLNIPAEQIKEIMDCEEFITAKRAVDLGLATEIYTPDTHGANGENKPLSLFPQNNLFRIINNKFSQASKQAAEFSNKENAEKIAELEKINAENEKKIAELTTNVERHLKYYDVCKDKVIQNIKNGAEFTAEIAESYADVKLAQAMMKERQAENQSVSPVLVNSHNDNHRKKAIEKRLGFLI